MRKYTLLLSVTFHVAAALTLIVAPLFAPNRSVGTETEMVSLVASMSAINVLL